MEVNIHEAKTHLSRLLERVAMGEEVIIAKAGEPMVRLMPVEQVLTPRKGGQWKGKATIADNFDEFDKDLEEMFYGKE